MALMDILASKFNDQKGSRLSPDCEKFVSLRPRLPAAKIAEVSLSLRYGATVFSWRMRRSAKSEGSPHLEVRLVSRAGRAPFHQSPITNH
jgi:hypothetical protein